MNKEELIAFFKKLPKWAKKNWYAIVVTAGSVLIAVEVLGIGAGWGVPFLSMIGYAIYRIVRKKRDG